MASRISPSSGCGLLSSRVRAHIIMPGVQKPHWRPCSSMKPCWMGSRSPLLARPSTVPMVRPSAIAANTVQDLTASPSMFTTQAPQLLVSHAQWVPVRPRWSRSKCTSSSRGSISRDTCSPLTVIVTCTSGLLTKGAGRGPAQRAPGELARKRAFVGCRSPLVVGGRGGFAGQPAGFLEQLGSGGLAFQDILGGGGVEAVYAYRGQADTGVADGVAVNPEGGTGGGDGPIAGAPLDLLVGAAGAGADRQTDLDQHLALLHGGLVGPDVEVVHGDAATAARPGDHGGGVEGGTNARKG